VLYAAHPEAGNPIDWPNWDGWKDPLFKEALKVIKETQQQASEKHGYHQLFRLQMAYLLLWSAIERYLTFRYSAAGSIEKRIEKLSTEEGFAELVEQYVAKANGQAPKVVDARVPGGKAYKLDPSRTGRVCEILPLCSAQRHASWQVGAGSSRHDAAR
jgi:hypothetical protein